MGSDRYFSKIFYFSNRIISEAPCLKSFRFISSRCRVGTRTASGRHVFSHGSLGGDCFFENLSCAIATPLRIPSRYKCTTKQMHNDMASVESRSDLINLNWCFINLVDQNRPNVTWIELYLFIMVYIAKRPNGRSRLWSGACFCNFVAEKVPITSRTVQKQTWSDWKRSSSIKMIEINKWSDYSRYKSYPIKFSE